MDQPSLDNQILSLRLEMIDTRLAQLEAIMNRILLTSPTHEDLEAIRELIERRY